MKLQPIAGTPLPCMQEFPHTLPTFSYRMCDMLTIVWFRRDLRRHDQPALNAATGRGAVIPAYILDPAAIPGGAGRWWLHHALSALNTTLPLWFDRGQPQEILPRLARSAGADAVFWCAGTTPAEAETDRQVADHLSRAGIAARIFPGNLLLAPQDLHAGTGGPYKVYTAFWRAAQTKKILAPTPPPKTEVVHPHNSTSLEGLGLLPRHNWSSDWLDLWRPGEAGAFRALDTFLSSGIGGYETRRNYPAEPHTSHLSAHLHFGELSVRLLWHRVHLAQHASAADRDKFLSEVGWREFAYYLLYYRPDMLRENWNRSFDAYPWQENPNALEAWQKGMTGYPLVDAGMRELWQTGYMHNRVRMVAASFLTKHLRIHWRTGADWFADTLVDADEAANAASWQWVAGSGADAAPYFRIFNPLAQGTKFDPDGSYIRRWCPELADLPSSLLHAQDETAAERRTAASHNQSYPLPVVAHDSARIAALEGYQRLRSARS